MPHHKRKLVNISSHDAAATIFHIRPLHNGGFVGLSYIIAPFLTSIHIIYLLTLLISSTSAVFFAWLKK